MLPNLTFILSGPPRGKGRPRSRIACSRRGDKFIAVYTDAKTRSYEEALRAAGVRAMKEYELKAPFDGALRVYVTAVFPIPKSWPLKRKELARDGLLRPTGKPDIDNIFKLLDGVNGVVWKDDSQIVHGTIVKVYGDTPQLEVRVWCLEAMPLFEAGGEKMERLGKEFEKVLFVQSR